MSKDQKNLINLDRILVEEVGQWGRYQLRAVLMCAFASTMAGMGYYTYLFTIVKVETRCVIPECENSSALTVFSPPWILDAVPAAGDSFDNCHRFSTIQHASESCSADIFDRNVSIKCEEYVYRHNNSAYVEFGMACDNWRPTLVGSIRFLGMMISLPIMGFVADRWGRRVTLAITAFFTAWIGCLTCFSDSFLTYTLLTFGESLFSACSFACAYILAVEYVGPKHRVVIGVTISTFLSLGEVLAGLIAWTEPYWRYLILCLYVPQLTTVIYFWIAPESVRWLISKGRYAESLAILKEAAEMNGHVISESTSKGFSEAKDVEVKEKKHSGPWLVCLVFRNRPILIRCLVTPFWWFSCIMMHYGLTISSVGISGNKHMNYSASTMIQIVGFWIAVLLLDRIGRRAVVIAGFLICAAGQVAYICIPDGHYVLSLLVFLLSKMSIAAVVTSLYVYTAELYPTQYRSSLFAYSSMIGRVGGILAPLMPGLAAEVWEQLPFALFGGMALLSGLLVLLAPETLGKTLPDTMEDAANLGKDASSEFLQCFRTIMFRRRKTMHVNQFT